MRMPRSKLRMALWIVVPSALAVTGLYLVAVAGIVVGDPFDPSLFVLIGGTTVVATMALSAVLLIDRREVHQASSVDPPPPQAVSDDR